MEFKIDTISAHLSLLDVLQEERPILQKKGEVDDGLSLPPH